MSDQIFALMAIGGGSASFFNLLYWLCHEGSWDYIYGTKRNGLWGLFWFVIAIIGALNFPEPSNG